jgi:hypothetical protein
MMGTKRNVPFTQARILIGLRRMMATKINIRVVHSIRERVQFHQQKDEWLRYMDDNHAWSAI